MSKRTKNVVTAWVVVFIAFLGGVALANVQNKVPPVMENITAYLGIGYMEAGWLMSVFTVMGMVTAIPASWLLRKLGAKKIGVISLACAALGSIIGVFSTDFALLVTSRVLEGVGVGIIAVVGPAIIAMWFPPQKRGLPMGLWGSWMMVSQALLFLVAGTLATSFNWQGVWWFGLGFCVIVLLLYMWKVREPDGDMPNYAEAEVEGKPGKFSDGFKSGSTWLLSLIGLIFTFCCFGFATYIAVYWGDTFFMTAANDYNPELAQYEANLWVAALFAIEIPMVIFIGWLLNHVKLRKRKFVGAVGFMIYAIVLFFCFRMDAFALLVPFVIIYPFLEGSIPTVYWTLCPSTAKSPEHTGAALGVLNIGLNIGTLVGPPFTGWMIEVYGWQAATIPLALAAVIGGILFCFVKTYDKEPVEELSAASIEGEGAQASA